jgi:hypothetical protein
MFMSEVTGQGNATAERRRRLAAHAYRLAVVVGWQHESAANALNDVGGGDPQRVVWLNATDPGVSYERPDWPGPLDLSVPSTTGGPRRDHPARVRG